MLVVDAHALQPIDFLDFRAEIFGQRLHTQHFQNVVRIGVAIDQIVTLAHEVAFLHRNVLALGHHILSNVTAIFRTNVDPALGLVILTKFHAAIDSRDDSIVLGNACFEQFSHPRQTAGDVARLGGFPRNAGQHVTSRHHLAIGHRQHGVHCQQIARRFAGCIIQQGDTWAQIFLLAGSFPVSHHLVGQAGGFVDFFLQRDAFDNVLILHLAGLFGDHRQCVRIPLRHTIALGHRGPFSGVDDRAVGNAVDRAFAAFGVADYQLAVAGHGNCAATAVGDRGHAAIFDAAVNRRIHRRLFGHLRGAADVEGAHGQLRARLTDRLRRNDANRFPHVHRCAACQIAAIAGAAHAALGFAQQRRSDLHLGHSRRFNACHVRFGQQMARSHHDFAGLGIDHIHQHGAAKDTLAERHDGVAAFDDGLHQHSALRTAIILDNHAILADINQSAREIAGVRGLECRIGQTLAGAVGGVEILQHGKAFLEVGDDRRFDDLTRWLGHQAAHPGQLLHLRLGTASTGVRHHVDGVDRRNPAAWQLLGCADFLHHFGGDQIAALRPGIDDLVILFTLGDQAVLILLLEILHAGLGFINQARLGDRDDHVILAKADAGFEGVAEAQRHDGIGKQHRLLLAGMAIDNVDDVAQFLLGQQAVDGFKRHLVAFWQGFPKQQAARRGVHPLHVQLALIIGLQNAGDDLGVQRYILVEQRLMHFGHIGEGHALARLVLKLHGQIIKPKHHVLRRHDDRLAVGRGQDVVGRHHQHARFQLGLKAQRHVHGHLVTIEIGVERSADQRVELDGLALDQDRLKRLDAKPVQGRRAVEQHGMFADNLVEDIPNLLALLLDPLLGLLEGHRQTLGIKPRVDERLEQFQSHLLGQAALVQLQLRPCDNNRTAGIIDALAEQVLPEPALLALQHIRKRLQWTLVGAGDGAAAAAVVEQRINSFLQHALFVAHDDIRRAQFDQALQAVVAVDDAAIQIVEIGGCKAAAIQRHQRAQFRRNHRHHGQHHPLGLVAGIDEAFDHLHPLDDLLGLQF